MNTKQLEAIRIAEWLEGIRGNTWPSYIPQEAAAELRRLQSENEQLSAGYDAARQEIASLRAQPYDQQAMGLCHVCGWKGVIPYADGPVCVACEHDKSLSPQPTAQALDKDEAKAQRLTEKRWRRDGALLYRLTGEHRPTNFDEIRVTMANGSRDIGQMSAQAERLLVMLTAPQPAAPTQAGEYQPSSADMVMAALDTEEWGLERMQHWHCITDEGNREGAWLVKRQKAPYCAVYADKPGAPYGPRSWSGPTALDALQKAADDLGIRLPQPAARGAAQPAAQEDVPDMFWDADDTENFAHEIQDIVDGYGPGEIVTIECAKRMPNLKVLVTRNGDGVSYEHSAAQQGELT